MHGVCAGVLVIAREQFKDDLFNTTIAAYAISKSCVFFNLVWGGCLNMVSKIRVTAAENVVAFHEKRVYECL